MKDIIIAIISSGLLSGVLATVVSTISANKQKKKENTQKLEIGLRLILLSTLKRDGKDAINKGRPRWQRKPTRKVSPRNC